MEKLKICVTGANGFIGRKLVHILSKQGHNVTILSRKDNWVIPTPSNVKLIKGDLTSVDCPLAQFVDDCDIIYHCAGEINHPEMMKALHVDGTHRLIQAVLKRADQRGRPIHWVQLSSVGVYGPPQDNANEERVVIETSPYQPKGEYEITKKQSDDLVIHAADSKLMTYTIIRPSNVFGVDMPNSALRLLVNTVRRGRFFYIGRKGAVATYVHVDDVVDLLICCGTDHRAKDEIFNISNDCMLEEMINGIASTHNLKRPKLRLSEDLIRSLVRVMSFFVSLPLTPERINTLVARTTYSTSKLKQKLGFIPKKSVRTAISEVIYTK